MAMDVSYFDDIFPYPWYGNDTRLYRIHLIFRSELSRVVYGIQ